MASELLPAARRQQNQFGHKQGGLCWTFLYLAIKRTWPKIKFHMLWHKATSCFKRAEPTILLKTPLCPVPAPAPYCSSLAQGPMKTNPPSLSDFPSAHTGLHFRVCVLKANGQRAFAKTPTMSKMALVGPDLRPSPLSPPPLAYGPDPPEQGLILAHAVWA